MADLSRVYQEASGYAATQLDSDATDDDKNVAAQQLNAAIDEVEQRDDISAGEYRDAESRRPI